MNNKRCGLSIIEITISMGILALIMLPVFMTFSTGNRNMQLTESEFRAHTAAIEIMEQLVSLPFKLLQPGKYSSEQVKNGQQFGNTPVVFKISELEDYHPSISIEEVKKAGKTIFKKISITIKYPAARKSERMREFTLKTMVANENT